MRPVFYRGDDAALAALPPIDDAIAARLGVADEFAVLRARYPDANAVRVVYPAGITKTYRLGKDTMSNPTSTPTPPDEQIVAEQIAWLDEQAQRHGYEWAQKCAERNRTSIGKWGQRWLDTRSPAAFVTKSVRTTEFERDLETFAKRRGKLAGEVVTDFVLASDENTRKYLAAYPGAANPEDRIEKVIRQRDALEQRMSEIMSELTSMAAQIARDEAVFGEHLSREAAMARAKTSNAGRKLWDEWEALYQKYTTVDVRAQKSGRIAALEKRWADESARWPGGPLAYAKSDLGRELYATIAKEREYDRLERTQGGSVALRKRREDADRERARRPIAVTPADLELEKLCRAVMAAKCIDRAPAMAEVLETAEGRALYTKAREQRIRHEYAREDRP